MAIFAVLVETLFQTVHPGFQGQDQISHFFRLLPTQFDQFVSDPAHPVPYRQRPIQATYFPGGSKWSTWLVEDQRFVDDRPDVLSWETGPLEQDLTIAGEVTAKLFASTIAEEVASQAIEIFGGVGVTREYPVEKLYRDVKIGRIYEGTSNLQRLTIAKQLLG